MNAILSAAPNGRPSGGYVLISVTDLCRAWTAYRMRCISLVDLRAWFACHEMLARRCKLGKGRTADYSFDELHKLVGGVGGEHLRKAVRRLQTAGLLTWSASQLLFCAGEPLDGNAQPMIDAITNNRRRVPVPRRILRYLSLEATKATIATVLGHLLRCVYFRGGACTAAGTCKASWIARVFGVDCRNVKAARKRLVAVGWLCISSVPQWRLNRFGASVLVNLSWALDQCTSKTPQPEDQKSTSTPPPDSNKELLSEYRNQKPKSAMKSGLESKDRNKAPNLKNIVLEDLSNTKRTLSLFEQAVRVGIIKTGEAARLRFVAAAEHARRVGRTNPCGLLAAILRRGLWGFITQQDEDCAATRLKGFKDQVAARRNTSVVPGQAGIPRRPEKVSRLLESIKLGKPLDG